MDLSNNGGISNEYFHYLPSKTFLYFGEGQTNNSGLHLLQKGVDKVEISEEFSVDILIPVTVNIPITSAKDHIISITLPTPPNGMYTLVGTTNESGEVINPDGSYVAPDSEGNITILVGFKSDLITDEEGLLASGLVIHIQTSTPTEVGSEVTGSLNLTIPVVKLVGEELPFNRKVRIDNKIPRDVKNTAYFAVEVEGMLFNSDFSKDLLENSSTLRDENHGNGSLSAEYLMNTLSFWCERDGTLSVRGETNKGYGVGRGKEGIKVRLIPSPLQGIRSKSFEVGTGKIQEGSVFRFNLTHRVYFPCSYSMGYIDHSKNPEATHLTYSFDGLKPVTIVAPSVNGYGSIEGFKRQLRKMYLDSKGTGYSFVDSQMFNLPNLSKLPTVPEAGVGDFTSLAGLNFHETAFFHQKSEEVYYQDLIHHGSDPSENTFRFKDWMPWSYYNESRSLHIFRTEGIAPEKDLYFRFGDSSEKPVTFQSCNNLEFTQDCVTKSATFVGGYELFSDPLPTGQLVATYRVNYGEVKQYSSFGDNGVHDTDYISRFLESIIDEEGRSVITTEPVWDKNHSTYTPFFCPEYGILGYETPTLYPELLTIESASEPTTRVRKSYEQGSSVNTVEFFITESIVPINNNSLSYINVRLDGLKSKKTDLVELLFGEDTIINSCKKSRWGTWNNLG